MELHTEECLLSQNLILRNGMVKRGGQTLGFNNTEATASKKILGLHRFYFGSSKERLVAVDTKIRKDDEDNTWTDVVTGLTTGLPTDMTTWGALDKVYISNGTDRARSYDGTTVVNSATITITLGGVGNAETFYLTIDETAQGTGGIITEGVEWTQGATAALSATALAAYLNGLSGITAVASTNVVTITPAATTDIPKFADGTVSDLALSTHLAMPAKTIQTLPYQDRLLSIDDNDPGELKWSKSFVDSEWELRDSTSVRPDTKLYGMIIHGQTNVSAGYEASVLLAGADSMYLFKATDMRPPSSTGDYTIYPLAIKVGCNAPKTMVWTPKGSMWLGIDRQVYLLPVDSSSPIAIGDKIRSNSSATEGIEKIPAAQIQNACAVYHDGFYKLSVARQGDSTNNTQWWLDIGRVALDENNLIGPWYGPMTGQSINVFATQSGPGDTGQLIGGEATAKGYIYELGDKDDYGDIDTSDGSTKAISTIWQTFYHPLTDPDLAKDVFQIEAELLDVLGTVNVEFHDITGALRTGDSFGLSGTAEFWDDNYWNEEDWSSSAPTRQVVTISAGVQPRRLSIIIKLSTSNDKHEIFSLKAEVKEQRLVFANANVT
jgi:hypothetical protein